MLPTACRRASTKLAAAILFVFTGGEIATAVELPGIDNPIHGYWTTPPRDRFSRLKAELEGGRKQLDTSGEIPFLKSLLRELDVPVSSQMLVFSVTSLQKNLISPRRPRALYFNDDTYVGYVPGGRIEVISLDPDLGGIFYIFDRFRTGQLAKSERSDECMTCHAPRHMQEIPGLVIESVVPGVTGGGEKAFRRERSGHDIPFEERFGGWHVTGAQGFPHPWANMLLEYTPAGRQERRIHPGELFDVTQYPLPTSDLLPQLLQEHQVGFINRALQANYRTRELLHKTPGSGKTVEEELERLAGSLVSYLLFADEVPLPATGVSGDAEFKKAFVAGGRRATNGTSLRDLDLRTRLLRFRCSYMIYSPAFTGLHSTLKTQVVRKLRSALDGTTDTPESAHLSSDEKQAIRTILAETIPDLRDKPGAGSS